MRFDQAIVPEANLTLRGEGNERTIGVTPVAGRRGITTITIVVSDGEETAEGSFELAVVAGPERDDDGDGFLNKDEFALALLDTSGDGRLDVPVVRLDSFYGPAADSVSEEQSWRAAGLEQRVE